MTTRLPGHRPLRDLSRGVLFGLLLVTHSFWGPSCGSTRGDADRARRYTERGDVALALWHAGEAEHAYRAALEREPGLAEAQRGLARALTAAGAFEAAVDAFDALAAQHPARFAALATEYCDLLGRAAEAAMQGDRPDRAISLARRRRAAPCVAPARDALLARALQIEAEAALASGLADEAVELHRAAIEADSGDPGIYRTAALGMLAAGRRDEALTLLSEALARHPEDRALHVLTVDVLAGRAPGSGAGLHSPEPPPSD